MKMKKWLALFFAAVMVLSIAACGEEKGAKTNKKKAENTKQQETEPSNQTAPSLRALSVAQLAQEIEASVATGNYEEAYRMAVELFDRSDEGRRIASIWFNKLIFVPVEVTCDTEYASFTYDEQGRLLTAITNREASEYQWASIRGLYNDNGAEIQYTYANNAWGKKEITYNAAGKPVALHGTSSNGELWTETATYDEKGREIAYETSHPDANWSESKYTYYADGTLHTQKDTNADGTRVRTYDEDGRLLSERHDYSSEEGWMEKLNTYDENGNILTSSSAYDNEGDGQKDYEYYAVCTYDENDNLLSLEVTENNSWHKFIDTYDEKGNLLTSETIYSDGRRDKTSYTYDKDGNCLSQESENSKTVYTYDENGNVVTQDYTKPDGNREKTAYTYDEEGNLVREQRWNEDAVCILDCTFDPFGNPLTTTQPTNDAQVRHSTATWKLFYYPDGPTTEIMESLSIAIKILPHFSQHYNYDSIASSGFQQKW